MIFSVYFKSKRFQAGITANNIIETSLTLDAPTAAKILQKKNIAKLTLSAHTVLMLIDNLSVKEKFFLADKQGYREISY